MILIDLQVTRVDDTLRAPEIEEASGSQMDRRPSKIMDAEDRGQLVLWRNLERLCSTANRYRLN